MDLTSKKVIQNLLRQNGIHPSKRLGQYFLIDKKILKKIIEVANLKPEDIVVEIGPGIGTLTIELTKRVKKVIAVEKDKRMCRILKETLRGYKNVEIVNKDILDSRFKILDSRFKIVSNLPYYITSPVIRKFLEADYKPLEMILMVQKEVAQRICAEPEARMSLLAVSVQFYARPEIIATLSKKSFWPVPEVDSAILRIKTLKTANIDPEKSPTATNEADAKDRQKIDTKLFFRIVKAGFSSKRKQLINSLSAGLNLRKGETQEILKKADIGPKRRAETLSVDEWIKLYNIVEADKHGSRRGKTQKKRRKSA